MESAAEQTATPISSTSTSTSTSTSQWKNCDPSAFLNFVSNVASTPPPLQQLPATPSLSLSPSSPSPSSSSTTISSSASSSSSKSKGSKNRSSATAASAKKTQTLSPPKGLSYPIPLPKLPNLSNHVDLLAFPPFNTTQSSPSPSVAQVSANPSSTSSSSSAPTKVALPQSIPSPAPTTPLTAIFASLPGTPTTNPLPLNPKAKSSTFLRSTYSIPASVPPSLVGKMTLPLIRPMPFTPDNGAPPEASKLKQLKKYRESHNEVERRRRENINQIIGELAGIVPDCHPGQAKGSILRKTADYIRAIQTKIANGEIVCRNVDGEFVDPTTSVKRALEEEEERAAKKLKSSDEGDINEEEEEGNESEEETTDKRSLNYIMS